MRGVLVLAMAFWLTAAAAAAQLTPDEVALIAMAQSDRSRSLAAHYAKTRGVPQSQILLLPGDPGGTLSRTAWQTEIRPLIRLWLLDNNLHQKVRCFVTCWDVPLRIGRRDNDAPEVLARKGLLDRSRAILVDRLDELIETLDSLVPRETPAQETPAQETPPQERPTTEEPPEETPPTEEPPDGETTRQEKDAEEAAAGQPAEDQPARAETDVNTLTAQFHRAFTAARARLQKIESEEQRRQIGVALERAFVASGGVSGLLQLIARHGGAKGPDAQKSPQIQRLQGQLQGLGQGMAAVDNMPDMPERDMQMLSLVRTASGLIGALQWIDQQRGQIQRNETGGSFDSELSLLHWSDYPLEGWRPNVLHYRWDDLLVARPTTLMVTRLEAPTYELAQKLIDTAAAVEQTGLTGKVYLDARGIKFDPTTDKPGSYGRYDQSLRDLQRRLTEHTKLEVVLDDEAKLFQPGDCPQAALYCGWYSLAKYVDAFDWLPGAVGYHMASSEAATLRKPGGKVWCNAMLEDGITATLGPVQEPYLSSFPLPDDFFSLLLTGRHTLAEVYYRTKPYNSWAMVLVGDPLYNPFKNNPQLDQAALPSHLRQKPLGPRPRFPAALDAVGGGPR